ncbi:hypothetical protein QX233_14525 [Chryseobacterium gambrini]|uniref:Uncharacterized protein n=1 Tax=Chryseobacterium gambrini TaxID=373672 RepID=A0AAJ1R5Z7_9FLAO|nr:MULTISPECIES: hypothetical protein [Chryseobacterium]MDN4013690.1 hypothetical protein [Chryseobacterium gambrini]MDN4028055.1 hypothetical protein [Chryseobacterium gambrini]QWA39771.1 hypothetical protein KKI44_06070 [Chryseobacterium sp. ZHDP1]
MPIPDFDHNNVLPPHLGNPALISDISPYECTTLELCKKFSTSPHRVNLLEKFIEFRMKMRDSGMNCGFQWMDGSFLENIEVSESRQPRDIDVVTFFQGLTIPQLYDIKVVFPEFFSPKLAKNIFFLDHYFVPIDHDPISTVESARYWIQLFTHKRNGIWKGMLKIPLDTTTNDIEALNYLKSLRS